MWVGEKYRLDRVWRPWRLSTGEQFTPPCTLSPWTPTDVQKKIGESPEQGSLIVQACGGGRRALWEGPEGPISPVLQGLTAWAAGRARSTLDFRSLVKNHCSWGKGIGNKNSLRTGAKSSGKSVAA